MNDMQQYRILISGSSGFVGQNLIQHFNREEYVLTGLSRANSHAGENGLFKQLNWKTISAAELNNTDAIIHLAGKAHDVKNVSDPQEYFTVNTGLTQQLFDLFLQSSTKDFIYFSSVKAAADTVDGILDETAIPNPQTAYGQSKLKAEEYLLSAVLPQGKRVIIIRPCMIHGPGNKGNLNLLYQFVQKGIPYPLAAFDNQRSFLSVHNLCCIIEQVLQTPTVVSGIYHVSDDETLSTNQVVSIISTVLNRKPRLLSIPQWLLKALASIGDKIKLPLNSERLKKLTESYVVSNKKIKQALQIERLPLSAEEGLRKTIESFRSL